MSRLRIPMMHGRIRYAGHRAGPGELASIDEVFARLGRHVLAGPTLGVPLRAAHGAVLAESVRAVRDYPAFDKSMVDGFALHSADVQDVPVELDVCAEIAAGEAAVQKVSRGQCVRINTGAPIPAGADAVVMVEHTEPAGTERVRVLKGVEAGRHVVRGGSDCRRGDTVLEAPMRVGPAQIACAASAGVTHVSVFDRPTVALLVTGDEIVPVGAAPGPSQIFDSNGPTLAALTREAGAEVIDLGLCGDDRAVMRERLSRAMASRIVVVVGGMSMGTLDLAPEVLESLGVDWKVHGVDIRPGRPMAFGIGSAGTIVFGLPGNPVSSFVCFSLFVRAAIAGLCGFPVSAPSMMTARLEGLIRPARDPRPAYVPARLVVGASGDPVVSPVAWHGSGDTIGLGRANALLHVPAGGAGIDDGRQVRVVLLELPGA